MSEAVVKGKVSQGIDELCDKIKASDDPKQKLQLVLEMMVKVAGHIDACWHWAKKLEEKHAQEMTAMKGALDIMEQRVEDLTQEVRRKVKKAGEE